MGDATKAANKMSIASISREVQAIQKKHDETDVARLCKAMGITVLYHPMGDFDGACKGFYLSQSRKQVIMVNSNLSEGLQQIIMAHELGHAVLHKKVSGLRAFHDFVMFDETSQYEFEANIFAADLLMTDSEVLALLNDDISFFAAAAALQVPPELLDFKFRVLKRKGYKVIDPPFVANSDFLKKVR